MYQFWIWPSGQRKAGRKCAGDQFRVGGPHARAVGGGFKNAFGREIPTPLDLNAREGQPCDAVKFFLDGRPVNAIGRPTSGADANPEGVLRIGVCLVQADGKPVVRAISSPALPAEALSLKSAGANARSLTVRCEAGVALPRRLHARHGQHRVQVRVRPPGLAGGMSGAMICLLIAQVAGLPWSFHDARRSCPIQLREPMEAQVSTYGSSFECCLME